MKAVIKGAAPVKLQSYRIAVPNSTWEQMKTDPHFGGMGAYHDCRLQTIADQGGLCAYCEIQIKDNDSRKCRVEHFHPKSDITPAHNWALDWQNLLAVCNGGSHPHVAAQGFHREPTNANLSCDAHKEKMISSNKLAASCEGWILNPLQLHSGLFLFDVDMSSGKLKPHAENCDAVSIWPQCKHASTCDLVQHTIDMLNLNCDRLIDVRLRVLWDIERNLKKERDAGFTVAQAFSNLAQRYYRSRWPAFFTTIQIRLGVHAKLHLQSINYQG